MGVSKKGILVILSSPSGAGKTSIARALVKGNESFLFSVSATTRKSRPGEVNGREYDFLTAVSYTHLTLPTTPYV